MIYYGFRFKDLSDVTNPPIKDIVDKAIVAIRNITCLYDFFKIPEDKKETMYLTYNQEMFKEFILEVDKAVGFGNFLAYIEAYEYTPTGYFEKSKDGNGIGIQCVKKPYFL